MSLFRLDASIRVEGSRSRALADLVEHEWRAAHPGAGVLRRDVGIAPVPATTWGTAAFAGYVPEGPTLARTDRSHRHRGHPGRRAVRL